MDVMLRQLGFTFRGHHRSKPVRLWTQGRARVVCNEQLARDWEPTLAAVGVEVADPTASAARARLLDAPAVFRRTPGERAGPRRLPGAGRDRDLPRRRRVGRHHVGAGVRGRRRAGRRSPHRHRPRQPRPPVADVRRGGAVLHAASCRCGRRAARRWRPPPGWCAATSSAATTAASDSHSTSLRWPSTDPAATRSTWPSRARTRWPSPARPGSAGFVRCRSRATTTTTSPPASTSTPGWSTRWRSSACSTTGTARGDFLHFYTETVGGVFFEVVERRGGYDGYGAPNAPVRLAAQHLREARSHAPQ